jgi:hypothetical protein
LVTCLRSKLSADVNRTDSRLLGRTYNRRPISVNRQVLNRPASPTFLRVGLGLGLVTAAIASTAQADPTLLSGLQDVGAAKALAVRNAVSVKDAGVAGAFGTVATDGISGADLQDVDGTVEARQPVPRQADGASTARSGFRHPLTASRTRPITQTSALVRAAKAQTHALESGALTLLPTTPATDSPSTGLPATGSPSSDLPLADLATPTIPATPATLAPPAALTTTPASPQPTAQPTTQSALAAGPEAEAPAAKSATSPAIAPPATATPAPADPSTPIYQATAAALSTQYQHPDDRGEGSTQRRAPRHRLADAGN